VLGDLVPRQKSILSMRRQLAEKRAVIAKRNGQGPSLSQVQTDHDRARAFADEWQKAAPVDGHLVGVVGKLSSIASETGVRVNRLSPQDKVEMAVLSEHSLRLALEGDFHQLAEFVSRLETLRETIWIRQLAMKQKSEDGNTVECELMLSVFADNRGVSG
jgi:Tfp pilus assembly protein PilO